ncbi:MAG: hypothetical protein ACREJU_17420 [Nitrospiraceae bacterium]
MLSRYLARSERYDQDQRIWRDNQARKNRDCLQAGGLLSLYSLLVIFVAATVWVRVHYDIPAAPPLIQDVPLAEEETCVPDSEDPTQALEEGRRENCDREGV